MPNKFNKSPSEKKVEELEKNVTLKNEGDRGGAVADLSLVLNKKKWLEFKPLFYNFNSIGVRFRKYNLHHHQIG